MPDPDKFDSKGKRMSACMSHEHMKEKYKHDKRAEVCEAMWYDSKNEDGDSG